MSRNWFGTTFIVGFLMALGLAGASHAEDGRGFAIECGAACGLGTRIVPDALVAQIPGGLYVITVAYLAPSPEDAFEGGDEVVCDSVEFRVDTLRIGGRDGAIAVEIGEKQELAPGKSLRLVSEGSPNAVAAGPEMDQLAFSLRAAKVKGPCSLVAGGTLFEESSSTRSVPFSLLLNDGTSRNRRAAGR